MTAFCLFMLWTFLLYAAHRLAHLLPWVRDVHADHHKQIAAGANLGLHWSNLFLYFDSPRSTLDQWLTEVLPTLLLAGVTGHWWLFGVYYVWAALIQEAIEHNPNFDWHPWLTSGRWHLVHHADNSKNFGVFFPVWDTLFGTRKDHDGD